MGASIEIRPEPQRNILNFGYGINYKYEGMLAHSFDRFYVVTKFMLPMIGNLKFSKLDFDYTCAYMEKEYAPNTDSRKYMLELRANCNKVKPFVSYYNKLINSYNNTAHNNLDKEIKLLLPQVNKRQKCGIITTAVSSFIGLVYEGISSFLQHKKNNALHKTVNAMNNKVNIQCNKLMKLDYTMLMNGIYNAETLEKLFEIVCEIHNTTSLHEKLFAGEHNHSIVRILYTHSLGLQHYFTNSYLYLRIIQDKYISLYRELITQLHTYVSAVRTLAKGYLSNTLIKPNELQEILTEVKNSLHITNPDYSLVLDRLHLYYDMQLITFSIDKDMNPVIQFLVFIQPCTQKYLVLYQLETVPVPILDRNIEAQSYTHLQVRKHYVALNSETYIFLRHQKLRSCKRIGCEFYCEELFVVKHKSSYSCESAIYFNLTTDIIKNNCNFDFYFNKTDVTPTILDGGDEIVLATSHNDKHIICNVNNDIPFKIQSHPYVLVNRSVLCNCGIEADNHYLLESLATCDDKAHNLVIYFTINMAFTNYLDMLPNLTRPSLIRDRTTHEQPLAINLNFFFFGSSLKDAPTKMKRFMHSYAKYKENFDFKQRYVSTAESLNNSNKNFFSNNYIVDIFAFTSSIISLISTTLVIYLFCKQKHIRTLVASLVLHKIKEVEANPNSGQTNSGCGILTYVGIIPTVLSMIIVIFLHYRKSRLCKGYRFLNAIKIMLFISDIQNCVSIKLCKTAGSIHLFKMKGALKSGNIKLNKNYLWDTLEIDLNGVTVTFNNDKIELSKLS